MNDYKLALLLEMKEPKGISFGPEDKISRNFAIWLRDMFYANKLNGVFLHIPNEGKGRAAMVKKKAIGLVPGAADWLILANGKNLFIELKDGNKKLNENQKIFKYWCSRTLIPYYKCGSLEEAIEVVKLEGFISD